MYKIMPYEGSELVAHTRGICVCGEKLYTSSQVQPQYTSLLRLRITHIASAV